MKWNDESPQGLLFFRGSNAFYYERIYIFKEVIFMAKFNAKEATWEKVEVLGKEGLFTGLRIDKNTVPDGWYFYEVRHDDDTWGDPVEIALGVLVNHFGTLLTREPFELVPSPVTGNAYLDIDAEKDWDYLGETIRLEH